MLYTDMLTILPSFTESLDRDRFIRLHLRAEKASLARVDSKSIYLALKVS